VAISSYPGSGPQFATALCCFASLYAAQNEREHAQLEREHAQLERAIAADGRECTRLAGDRL
jgi:hypothetical protein